MKDLCKREVSGRKHEKCLEKEATEHFEVIELYEPDKIVLRCDGTKGTTGKGEFVFTYILSSSDNDTEVTLNGEINGLTGLSKIFGKMMIGVIQKSMCERYGCVKNLFGEGKRNALIGSYPYLENNNINRVPPEEMNLVFSSFKHLFLIVLFSFDLLSLRLTFE